MYVKFSLQSPSPQVLREAAEVIRRGGVVLYPSDTIYGLGCDPFQNQAVDRLFELKGRPRDKGVLLLVPHPDWVHRLVEAIPSRYWELTRRFWPGPLTVLLPARSDLGTGIVGEEGKVGIRYPDTPFLQQWMEEIPGPLVSTSANRSGEPPQTRIEELRRQFEGRVSLFLDGGELPSSLPSTVVDLCEDPPRLVRWGVGAEAVVRFLEGSV